MASFRFFYTLVGFAFVVAVGLDPISRAVGVGMGTFLYMCIDAMSIEDISSSPMCNDHVSDEFCVFGDAVSVR
jgi:hypothetical protein